MIARKECRNVILGLCCFPMTMRPKGIISALDRPARGLAKTLKPGISIQSRTRMELYGNPAVFRLQRRNGVQLCPAESRFRQYDGQTRILINTAGCER